MSLSFREHAAIAFATTRDGGAYRDSDPPAHVHPKVAGEWVCTDTGAALMAQELADACCKKFGHHEEPFFLRSAGAGTIAAGGVSQSHMRCARCGVDVK